jgi:hypothetical protein
MTLSAISLRRLAAAAFVFIAFAAATSAGRAQVRNQIAVKVATDAGNQFVAKINGENCEQFAQTMAQMKEKSSSASPSPMSAKLKSNADARTAFVNVVAAPLLNKMIDCGTLPGGM